MPRTTIKSLAAQIQAEFPHLKVEVRRGYSNTDSKVAGTRFVRKGKGRTGTEIIVRDPAVFPEGDHDAKLYGGKVLLRHNNADSYRRTSEVVAWVEEYRKTLVLAAAHRRKGSRAESNRRARQTSPTWSDRRQDAPKDGGEPR